MPTHSPCGSYGFGPSRTWGNSRMPVAPACAGLDRHPTSAELTYLHAVLLAEMSHFDAAAQAARRALYLDRNLIVAHLALARALTRPGDTAAALAARWRMRAACSRRSLPTRSCPAPMESQPVGSPRWRGCNWGCSVRRPPDGRSTRTASKAPMDWAEVRRRVDAVGRELAPRGSEHIARGRSGSSGRARPRPGAAG